MSNLKLTFLASLAAAAVGLTLLGLGGLLGFLTGETLAGALLGLGIAIPMLAGLSFLSLHFTD